MAILKINDYIDFDTDGEIISVSWQVALDPNYTQIIDQSLEDKVNKREWITKLPVIGATDGSCYADLDAVYSRVKIHMNGAVSPWFEITPLNQNDQSITYNELDGTRTTYNTITDNIS